MMRGNTVSEDVVAKTISSSSRIDRMSASRLKPQTRATIVRIPKTKIRQVT